MKPQPPFGPPTPSPLAAPPTEVIPMDCEFRCVTCDLPLRDRAAVREHWLQYSEGHSVYQAVATGTVHHQTIEGLHRRNWELAPPTTSQRSSPPPPIPATAVSQE